MAQRRKPRALQIVAIKQIVRIEGNQAAVRVHDVDAGLLHRAHVESVCVEKLHDEHAKNIRIGQIAGRRDFWQTAQEFAQ